LGSAGFYRLDDFSSVLSSAATYGWICRQVNANPYMGDVTMDASEMTVFIVDDDTAARESVSSLVSPMGMPTKTFASAEEFLDVVSPRDYGCVVTDLRLAGMSGVDLKHQLNERGIDLPTIVLTGYADVKVAVKAMQLGAITLLEKPAGGIELWDTIRLALEKDEQRRARNAVKRALERRMQSLTEKERQVMDLIVAGMPNKTVARRLDVSLRTVEARRKAVFDKLGARSLALLVQLVIQAGEIPVPAELEVLANV
jgi:two-component system response regulator DctR